LKSSTWKIPSQLVLHLPLTSSWAREIVHNQRRRNY